MGLFDFWKKPDATTTAAATPAQRKWVGSIKAEWASTSNGKHEWNVFNLFVDSDGKRTVEINGANAANHPIYLTKIYPWLNGAPNEVVSEFLDSSDPSYWGDIRVAKKASRKISKK